MNQVGTSHRQARNPITTYKIVGGFRLLGEGPDLIHRKYHSLPGETGLPEVGQALHSFLNKERHQRNYGARGTNVKTRSASCHSSWGRFENTPTMAGLWLVIDSGSESKRLINDPP